MSQPTLTFPAIFISHGSPDLPLRQGAVNDFLKSLGQQLGKPKAILVISAHWATPAPVVSRATQPETIHDFRGFPQALYHLQYPAPGAPEVGDRVMELLNQAGIEVRAHANRGLDHGAWVPLMLMYPDANIPVTQLSIQPHADPAYHQAIGRALAPLRDEGVLILASGSATHNLGELAGYDYNSPSPDWVTQFADWLTEAIAHRQISALLNYRKLAPHATRNHPTEEHLLPLFVAIGAGGDQPEGKVLHDSYTLGLLSMAAYAFN